MTRAVRQVKTGRISGRPNENDFWLGRSSRLSAGARMLALQSRLRRKIMSPRFMNRTTRITKRAGAAAVPYGQVSPFIGGRLILCCALTLVAGSPAFAGSATWSPTAASGDWNTSGNWIPGTVPNGPLDSATFSVFSSTVTSVATTARSTEVATVAFQSGLQSSFTITVIPDSENFLFSPVFYISGTGIANNSGKLQNFVAAGSTGSSILSGIIEFTNGASAGSQTAFTNNGGASAFYTGGFTLFGDTSTAGNGSFTNNGAAAESPPGAKQISWKVRRQHLGSSTLSPLQAKTAVAAELSSITTRPPPTHSS